MENLPTTPTQPSTHPIWQHFSPRTLVLIVILAIITGSLLYLAIRQEQPTKTMTTVPTPTPSPAHATLSLVQESPTTGAVQTVAVVINSNQNQITGAQVSLAYDPTALSTVTIKSGSYFSNPTVLFNTVDKTTGRISYVLGVGVNSKEAKGSGVIATITYTILPTAKKTTKISFLPKTELKQEGVLGSVLKSTEDLTITIPQTLQISQPPTASSAAK